MKTSDLHVNRIQHGRDARVTIEVRDRAGQIHILPTQLQIPTNCLPFTFNAARRIIIPFGRIQM